MVDTTPVGVVEKMMASHITVGSAEAPTVHEFARTKGMSRVTLPDRTKVTIALKVEARVARVLSNGQTYERYRNRAKEYRNC